MSFKRQIFTWTDTFRRLMKPYVRSAWIDASNELGNVQASWSRAKHNIHSLRALNFCFDKLKL
jgi:hypothetical protein